MKEIRAIISPFMGRNVLHAFGDLGFLPEVTVSRISGWGRNRAEDADQIVAEEGHRMARQTGLEAAAPDRHADVVVAAIVATARRGRVGDGKIFVTTIERAVRIWTGEDGEGAPCRRRIGK